MKYYGVEISGGVAYTEIVSDRSATVFGKQRNDFEGDKKACLDYIKSKGVTEVYGVLKDEAH
jgi:hypothetical protein